MGSKKDVIISTFNPLTPIILLQEESQERTYGIQCPFFEINLSYNPQEKKMIFFVAFKVENFNPEIDFGIPEKTEESDKIDDNLGEAIDILDKLFKNEELEFKVSNNKFENTFPNSLARKKIEKKIKEYLNYGYFIRNIFRNIFNHQAQQDFITTSEFFYLIIKKYSKKIYNTTLTLEEIESTIEELIAAITPDLISKPKKLTPEEEKARRKRVLKYLMEKKGIKIIKD